ncbi:hypothetical protein [Mesorhizobium sp. KR9-304]|uniref:hypothetical protein n=1 Tax=Mesorhizobium sp. KR9-304 TaxID=3156614 RepID=UPI0032B56E6A
MFDAVSSLISSVFSRGSSLSVPILDGALKPNNMIEIATIVAERQGLEDLALGPDNTLYAACGQDVLKLSDAGDFTVAAHFDQPVTALAFTSSGELAAGLSNAVVIGGRTLDSADGKSFVSVNALSATPDGGLLIADGSASRPYAQWSHDLMEGGRTGRLLRHDTASGRTTTLGSGLGYAFGAMADARGRILVSESWRHRLSVIENGRARVAVPALPGYPSRLAPTQDGGFWLTLFSCRTQLVEFVLQEDDYRHEMMRSIEPKYWVAPALSSGDDYMEPLQGGSVKQMGILKPWAPPRSYGLAVRFNADFLPLYSVHSRTGGRNHGIVAVVQRGDDLFLLSKGAGRVLRLSASDIQSAWAKGTNE